MIKFYWLLDLRLECEFPLISVSLFLMKQPILPQVVKYGAKVFTKLSDSHTSYISSVTIRASANNFLSWQSYKKIIQCCHVWWMCIRIMARNGHQKALIQLNKCLFAYFSCGTALTCPLDDSQWSNKWCARIKQLCKDLCTILYYMVTKKNNLL